jgi:hypothetical protein
MLQMRGDYILALLMGLNSHFHNDADENFSLLIYDAV